jgi:hypothetical protein
MLAAGLFQIGILWIQSIRFDEACGIAARRYASGEVEEKSIADAIWSALGASQKYFEADSIHIESPDSQTDPAQADSEPYRHKLDQVNTFNKYTNNPLFNYSKAKWCITVSYRCRPLLGFMFPHGIKLGTEVCVFRYQGGIS